MKNNAAYEWTVIAVNLAPVLYLAWIWPSLPEQVPTHWNLRGEVDDYDSRNVLWFLPVLMQGVVYLVLRYLPQIDPKAQKEGFEAGYRKLRMFLTVALAAITCIILYVTHQKATGDAAITVLSVSDSASLSRDWEIICRPYGRITSSASARRGRWRAKPCGCGRIGSAGGCSSSWGWSSPP